MRTPSPRLLCALAGAVASAPSLAAPVPTGMSGDGMWTAWSEMPVGARAGEAWIRPAVATHATLDLAGARALLSEAPMEFTEGARRRPVVLTLPTPEGGFQSFRVVESPILSPELQARFPHIRTYEGRGVEDGSAVARIDVTDLGLRAQVLTGDELGAWYVDPVTRGDTATYASYRKAGYRKGIAGAFRCKVDDRIIPPAAAAALRRSAAGMADGETDNFGSTLRQYRLAMAATGEYTQFYGGTTQALSGITTTVNRISGIYTSEVAVRFQLVANNNLIVYPNAATDPFSGTSAVTMLGQVQGVIDAAIGSANYDMGHVVSAANDGGVANLGVVCTGIKARGVSTLPAPVGDGFDVDYVAHEMGHQFSGTHTMNACFAGAQYTPLTQIEPGSGISIMGYAGICEPANNLAGTALPLFHSASNDQVRNWVTGTGSTCGTVINTGNAVPVLTVQPTYTIPARTPYMLSASATDANGDTLRFNWDQGNASSTIVNFDPVAANFPDNGFNPLVMPSAASTNPVRLVPRLQALRNGSNNFKAENLPTTNRTMLFRSTVRDGLGGVRFGFVSVTSAASAGPFRVTSQGAYQILTAGQPMTVTWDVAGTDQSPINCAQVRIEMSGDGAVTFPVTIGVFPNTGSATFPAPVIPGAFPVGTRVRVMAVDNIFFDINNADFDIQLPPCYPNCDGSSDLPVLNALDFSCFLQRYQVSVGLPAAQQVTEYANCDGSTSAPALNALDFACFLNRYRQGCP